MTLHSGSLQVRDQSNRPVTICSFRPRLLRLLVNCLNYETDSLNTQTLLHGLMCAVLDQVEYDSSIAANPPPGMYHRRAASKTLDFRDSFTSTDASFAFCHEPSSRGKHWSVRPVAPRAWGWETRFNRIDVAEGSIKDDSVFQDTHLLFAAIKTVCHNLTNSWKNDTSIVLTALEVLTVFARLHITEISELQHTVSPD